MTVLELILELNKYPPNMLVYGQDSEWGAEMINSVTIREKERVWDGPNYTIQDVVLVG